MCGVFRGIIIIAFLLCSHALERVERYDMEAAAAQRARDKERQVFIPS